MNVIFRDEYFKIHVKLQANGKREYFRKASDDNINLMVSFL